MIPKQYQWLTGLRGLPNTIRLALAEYGVQEVVGRGSNKTIIAWRDELNGAAPAGKPIVSGYSDDDVAWCGLFAAIIAYRRLKNIAEVVKAPLWARNWLKYGVKADVPMLGDVLVFRRGNGGHVGFYIGENDKVYFVLGGNQSNRVSIVAIEKSRLLGARRPPYKVTPISVRRYFLKSSGQLSTNEE